MNHPWLLWPSRAQLTFVMNTLQTTCVGMAVLVMATTSWSRDKEEALPDHELSEWKIGDIISGDQVALKDLKGKVVAIENWGIN